MMLTKQQIRKEMRLRKSGLSEVEKERAAEEVFRLLLSDDVLSQSENIVLFWSMEDEIFTHGMVEQLYKQYNVYLPVIVGDTLEFRLYEGRDSMLPDKLFGILEPMSKVTMCADAPRTTIVIPGVAFTDDGYRLGRGRGFYDRILKLFPNAYKVGICYGCQMMDTLPTEEHDIRMDKVYWA